VGKSSLFNALFGEKICEISDVKACTRDTKKVVLDLGGKGLTLMDVPGVGETNERDSEYAELYAKLLPELDLVLWVLKADDRAFSSDEKFYEDIVKPHIHQGKPFYFVLNQVDKIEPFREWDMEGRKPGVNQFSNIDMKIADVAQIFEHPKTQIVAVSANEKYNLVNLMDTIVYALPGTKKVTLYRKVPKENRSKEQETFAKEGLADEIRKIIREEMGDRAADSASEVFEENRGRPGGFWDIATNVVRHIPVVGGLIADGMDFIGGLFDW
jgi:small GTP-binding protein